MPRQFPREIPDRIIGFHRDWPETILQIALIALVLALLGWVAISLLRSVRMMATQPSPPGQPSSLTPQRADDALAALRMRYARGEIGREDYVQASIDLGAPPPPPSFRVRQPSTAAPAEVPESPPA